MKHATAMRRLARLPGALAARAKARRGTATAAAALLFGGGIAWAIHALGVSWTDLRWGMIALAFALLVPSLWLNAAELQLCARAAGNRLGMGQALAYSNTATLANLLPLPGGALVRAGALMKAGAGIRDSGGIVAAAALLWLGLAGAISTLAIAQSSAAVALASVCLLAVAAILVWIARRSGVAVAVGFLAVRLLLLGLTIVRLHLCFAATGADAALVDAAVYSVASILGSAAGVAPAGLGVAEGIGAMLALLASASPAEAFLALGLSRVVGLIGSALVVLWSVRGTPQTRAAAGA